MLMQFSHLFGLQLISYFFCLVGLYELHELCKMLPVYFVE